MLLQLAGPFDCFQLLSAYTFSLRPCSPNTIFHRFLPPLTPSKSVFRLLVFPNTSFHLSMHNSHVTGLNGSESKSSTILTRPTLVCLALNRGDRRPTVCCNTAYISASFLAVHPSPCQKFTAKMYGPPWQFIHFPILPAFPSPAFTSPPFWPLTHATLLLTAMKTSPDVQVIVPSLALVTLAPATATLCPFLCLRRRLLLAQCSIIQKKSICWFFPQSTSTNVR